MRMNFRVSRQKNFGFYEMFISLDMGGSMTDRAWGTISSHNLGMHRRMIITTKFGPPPTKRT